MSWEEGRLYTMGALHTVIEEALHAWPNDDDALHARIEGAITAYRHSKKSWQKPERCPHCHEPITAWRTWGMKGLGCEECDPFDNDEQDRSDETPVYALVPRQSFLSELVEKVQRKRKSVSNAVARAKRDADHAKREWRALKDETRYDRYCCLPGCRNPAEFAIFGESGYPDDHTDACANHVGALLGTPLNVPQDNRSWQITMIDPVGSDS